MLKQVIILRGISGAGKSTFAKKHFPRAVVCSADYFFIDKKTGTYRFTPSKLKQAHEACRAKFIQALHENRPLILVDNTNTRIWEFKFYVQEARKAGYKVRIIRLDTPVDVAANRNLHGVPQSAVQGMADRFENLPDFWAEDEEIVPGS